MSYLIEINNISKIYPSIDTAKQRLHSLISILVNKEIENGSKVLSNINLKIKKGESVAIIGKNGAGKSTLLKIISGITKATKGTVQVNGKIGALLELGSGFNPEYTGRENLNMSAALVGIKKHEINGKINEMIEFADIGDYIDQPVKCYSTGMIVRLGFSVVSVTKPELLITDEVLAVGDTDFQRKCIAWIDRYLKDGGTLLLVSHSLYHVQKLCKKALWLENGKVKKMGDSFIISQEYQSHYDNREAESKLYNEYKTDCKIKSFDIYNKNNIKVSKISSKEDINLEVIINSPNHLMPYITFQIKKGDYPIYSTNSKFKSKLKLKLINDEFKFNIKLPKNKLLPAEYNFVINAIDQDTNTVLHKMRKIITIVSNTHEMGSVILESKWK